MVVLDALQSDDLRYKYIQNFVDFASNYYIEKIQRTEEFRDGQCYIGYLWDCLINSSIISESEAAQVLQEKKSVFIMWDIHSCERILIPHYWKYPKSRILYTDKWSDVLRVDLPEDLYLFDDTFRWSVIYTHETDGKGNMYCIYLDKGFQNLPG